MNVRKKWPSITSAEERLMMLIKLKIKSKEAADILGISSDSIKKSRNRLRKRLELDIDINLDDYISKIT
jgi:DNA-binding CsgD family transcriptional regulator